MKISTDPKDNPYNLRSGYIYTIEMEDGQVIKARFSRIEVEIIPRYKFTLCKTGSLRLAATEFKVK
jgi:hypothetical protein